MAEAHRTKRTITGLLLLAALSLPSTVFAQTKTPRSPQVIDANQDLGSEPLEREDTGNPNDGPANASKKSGRSNSRTILPLRIGGHLGLGIASASLHPDRDSEAKSGFNLIGAIEFGFSPWFALTTELGFVQKGYKETSRQLAANTISSEVHLNYFEVPLLGKFRFGDDIARPFAVFGPALAFNLSAQRKAETTVATQDGTRLAANTDLQGIEATDIGLVFGGGVEVYLTDDIDLVGTVRYTHGLKDIQTNSDTEIYNRHFQILVGVLVDL